MKHEILTNGDLRITIDKTEQIDFQALALEDDFNSDNTMHEIFESLVANSELDWANPEDIGCLTSAPILAIKEDDEIEQAWGFMNYQLRSPQQDLMEKGSCLFQCGYKK